MHFLSCLKFIKQIDIDYGRARKLEGPVKKKEGHYKILTLFKAKKAGIIYSKYINLSWFYDLFRSKHGFVPQSQIPP